jgi:hypothetical protein
MKAIFRAKRQKMHGKYAYPDPQWHNAEKLPWVQSDWLLAVACEFTRRRARARGGDDRMTGVTQLTPIPSGMDE